MAYTNEAATVNRNFLISKLNLSEKTSNSIVFENEFLLVLSPTMQNPYDRFDINLSNIEYARNSTKKKLFILRYKEILLYGDLQVFLKKMTISQHMYTHKQTKKWQYTVKVEGEGEGYYIRLQGMKNSKFPVKEMNEDKLVALVNHLLKNKDKDKGDQSDIKEVNKTFFGITSSDLLDRITTYIGAKGFSYSKQNIQNLYLSLRTKPFLIISGISGTGKTKIVQLFAEAIGATEENGQFKLIPVRPDWSDSSELLGYKDIKGDFIKGPLTEMVEKAHQNPELPHFVLLDEMNLARVEYYFSDVLSVMESRKRVDGQITSSTLVTVEKKPLTLPGNLYIIGTVNMDETTHPFSKKVLDRANTIEFNEINLMNFTFMTNESKTEEPIRVTNEVLESSFIHLIDVFPTHEKLVRLVSEKLESINRLLEPIHAQVGYRVRDDISFYMVHNETLGQLLSENDAMDFCIIQKILPRVGGMEAVVRPVLKDLEIELDSYPRSSKKITEMLGRLDTDGFTSFWIS